MGTLIATEFMTLDGVAQAPGGPDEDHGGGFAHGGWQGAFFDADAGATLLEAAAGMDALLLGRRTYEIFSAYWPHAPADSPWTELLNRVPKHVASRTLAEPLGWAGSSLLRGDLATSVAELRDRYDELHVIGSLDLLKSLLRHGLVDQLRLWQYPLVLGTGKRVFGDGTTPTTMRLTTSVAHPHGVLELRYEPAGPPTYGEVEPS